MQALTHPLFQTLYLDEDGIFWEKKLRVLNQNTHVFLSIEPASAVSPVTIELASSIILDLDVLEYRARKALQQNILTEPEGICMQFWQTRCQKFHNSYLQEQIEVNTTPLLLTDLTFTSCIPLLSVGVYPMDKDSPVILTYSFLHQPVNDLSLYVLFSRDAEVYRVSY